MCDRLHSADNFEYAENNSNSHMLDLHHTLFKYQKNKKHGTVKRKNDMSKNKKKGAFLWNNIKYNHEYVEHFQSDNTCSMDIGGTLTKIIYLNSECIKEKKKHICDNNLKIKISDNKYLFLKSFKVDKLENALDFLINNNLIKKKLSLTGGGSYKYFYTIIERLLWSKLFQKEKQIIVQNNKTSFPVLEKKEQLDCHVIYVSKHYFCEQSKIFHIQIYICKEKHTDIDKVLNKHLIDSHYCQAVKFYYKNENCQHPLLKKEDAVETEEKNEKNENMFKEEELLLELIRKDEMQSVINGINILFNVTNCVVKYNFLIESEIVAKLKDSLHPFLLVNVGSGISFLKSDNFGEFKRVMGTAIGGGTFMGLAQLILGKISYKDLLELAEKGKTNFDLKLKNWKNFKMENKKFSGSDFLTSSFGSLNKILKTQKKKKNPHENMEFKQNICKSLIQMISFSIAQMAYLLAVAHNVPRIFFSGAYVNNSQLIMKLITCGVYYAHAHYVSNRQTCDIFSKSAIKKEESNSTYKSRTVGKKLTELVEPLGACSFCYKNDEIRKNSKEDIPEVLFLKHGGHVGAIGCFFS